MRGIPIVAEDISLYFLPFISVFEAGVFVRRIFGTRKLWKYGPFILFQSAATNRCFSTLNECYLEAGHACGRFRSNCSWKFGQGALTTYRHNAASNFFSHQLPTSKLRAKAWQPSSRWMPIHSNVNQKALFTTRRCCTNDLQSFRNSTSVYN